MVAVQQFLGGPSLGLVNRLASRFDPTLRSKDLQPVTTEEQECLAG